MTPLMRALLLAALIAPAHLSLLGATPPPQELSAQIRAADAVLTGQDGERLWLVKVGGRFRSLQRMADVPAADDILVVGKRNGVVVAIAQVSTSEAADWVNTYTHVFDPHGRTLAFRRESHFFNGACPGSPPEPLSETTYIYFTSAGVEASRTHELRDAADNLLTGQGCTFYYRHPHKHFSSLKALATTVGIAKWLP